jgi:hypothetical protein
MVAEASFPKRVKSVKNENLKKELEIFGEILLLRQVFSNLDSPPQAKKPQISNVTRTVTPL